MEKGNVEGRIEEIKRSVPSSWRNQAEWITVHLLEEILRELVEINEVNRMVSDAIPGAALAAVPSEPLSGEIAKKLPRKPAAKKKTAGSA